MKRLIVSADDFGLAGSVNEGIVRACKEGIVTCVNLMPSGKAFDDALRLAKEAGITEAGVHLALTETTPLIEANKVGTLVSADGSFLKSRVPFLLKLFTGRIDLDQVYIELKSQMDAAVSSCLEITNISSHEHLHMIPAILDIVIKLAREYDVPAIRYPHNDRSFLAPGRSIHKLFILSCLDRPMARMLRASSICYPDHFRGFFDSGALDEDVLIRIIETLDDGTTELVCHPGLLGEEVRATYAFHKNCEFELSALTARRVNGVIKNRGIELIGYGAFLSGCSKTGRPA